MIHISHQHQTIVVPYRADIAALLPHGKLFEWNGVQHIAIPHGDEETRLLRNFDMEVPAPIVEHYSWPSADGKRPFDKQVLTAAMMTMNRHCYILNDMGTGKTKSAIWAFDWLRRIGKAKRMLIVAPLSTLEFTWEREIMQTLTGFDVKILTGPRERRLKRLAEPASFYVINHHGLSIIANELKNRPDIDVICLDEAAIYRNARAKLGKVAREIVKTRKFVWAMTGSPTPTSPTDAYGLVKLVTPERSPPSFTFLREQTMHQVSQFRWVPKRDAAEVVANLLQPAVRFKLDEVTELPPVVEREVQVPLSKEQRDEYKKLKDNAVLSLKNGTITAQNGAILLTKLLQTSLGWVYDDNRNVQHFDNLPRLEALLDLIESTDRKVIVFSPFKSSAAGIEVFLKKHKVDVATVTGDTPPSARNDIFNLFQSTTKYRVLNAHPDCMAHGLTLTAADTVIWFGPVTKLETYQQANARIRRVGQTARQQVLKLSATPAERAIYTRLDQRRDVQNNVLELIAEIAGA